MLCLGESFINLFIKTLNIIKHKTFPIREEMSPCPWASGNAGHNFLYLLGVLFSVEPAGVLVRFSGVSGQPPFHSDHRTGRKACPKNLEALVSAMGGTFGQRFAIEIGFLSWPTGRDIKATGL